MMNKRFHIVFQQEQEDCGAACLAMITRFYGFQVKLEAVKAFCSNMKNGVSMFELRQAASKMGYLAHAVRLNSEELKSLPSEFLPFIAFWRQGHFVVVYKTSENSVFVADPALGKMKYKWNEFLNGFALADNKDGFALLLSPEHLDFQNIQNHRKQHLHLSDFVKPQRRQILWTAFSLIVLAAVGLVFPFLSQAIVDKGIQNKSPEILMTILCATLALVIGKTCFSFLQVRMTLIAGSLMDIALAKFLLLRLSSLPMKFFSSRQVGDIIQRVSDVSRIGDYFSFRLAESLLSALLFCVYSIILLNLYPLLFLIFLLGAISFILYNCIFLRKRKILDYEFFAAASKTQDELIQIIRGMTELKLACAEKLRVNVWEKLRLTLFDVSKKSLSLSQKQELGGVLIFQIVDAVIVFIVAGAVIEEEITLGAMMAVQYIIGSMESPLHIITSFVRDSQSMNIAKERIDYIVSENAEDDVGISMDFPEYPPEIVVNNLTFSYDTNQIKPVLSSVDAFIPSGKTTALVGMSGSGKTTFIKLVLGFYQPDSGDILVNGCPLADIGIKEWRKSIGIVMQDGYIFSDTILYNVSLGDNNPEYDRVIQALRNACADFVFDLPMGLNTIIGAEGFSLSSGQKQRILIARAIYKQPKLVILDEATNSLDTINETSIYDNLNMVLSGKTVIVAAHRLSTIQGADQILVFSHGTIVEHGTHHQLLRKNGMYSELIKNQQLK